MFTQRLILGSVLTIVLLSPAVAPSRPFPLPAEDPSRASDLNQPERPDDNRTHSSWHMEVVDTSSGWIDATSIALDEMGRPHISYQYWPPSALRYATKDWAGWHIEVVDDSASGRETSLALDLTGAPHIAYDHHGLRHAWREGSTWQSEMVDGVRYWGRDPSLAISPEGYPAIAYTRWSPHHQLVYAHLAASGWHTETIDALHGEHPSLKFDATGRPHVSYTWDDLFYAVREPDGWQVTTVISSPLVSFIDSSLAFDSAGRPAISYSDMVTYVVPSPSSLHHALFEGTFWSGTLVDGPAVDGSLAAGASGRLFVSYHFGMIPEEVGLRFATWSNGSWEIETVDSIEPGSGLGQDSSLALDGDERPHISYRGPSGRQLRYAVRDSPTAVQVMTFEATGLPPTTALDKQAASLILVTLLFLVARGRHRRRTARLAGR